MKDVAHAAGVSLGTVSNVLNRMPSVTKENRGKVEEAIKRLNYRPNSAARTLKTNASHSIGLIIPDIINPFYPEVSRGVEDVAMRNGYALLLCNNDRNREKERKYIDYLIEKQADGIILVKPSITPQEIVEIQARCAVVLVDAPGEAEPACDFVDVDDFRGSLNAMKMLCDLGHRRIAFIEGIASKSGSSRHEAYLRGLRDCGIEVDYALIKKGAYDWHSGHTCTTELLRMPDRPTAIFAANDLMAIGAIKAIHDRGLKVPEDISVLGYDDISMAALCQPALTTVRQPKYEIGSCSANLLLKRIAAANAQDAYPFQNIILETELLIRDSVGRCRKA